VKNTKIILGLIVSIILMSFAAKAQTTSEGPTGHGLLMPQYQYQTDADAVKSTFTTATYEAFANNNPVYFRADLEGLNPQDVVKIMGRWLKDQSGIATTYDEAAAAFSKTTFIEVGPEYWETHESAYLKSGCGTKLFWWDPRTSSLFHRQTWIIAQVIALNGVEVDYVAHCGNPVRDKQARGEVLSKTAPNAAGADVIIYNNNIIQQPRPQSYVVRQPVSPVYQHIADKNTDCHVGRTVLICAAIAAVAVVAYVLLKPKHPATVDNTYNNGFQGGSGSSGASGGSGGQQTW
jgi:hypothetical protein